MKWYQYALTCRMPWAHADNLLNVGAKKCTGWCKYLASNLKCTELCQCFRQCTNC